MAKGSEKGGCLNCYAARVALRRPASGLAVMRDSGPRWTGKVDLVEKRLSLPLRWRAPKRIFVNSMSDLFHESLPDAAIDRVFAVMAQSPQHTFQVLTKRPERMRSYMTEGRTPDGIDEAAVHFGWCHANISGRWPLPNVWLGVSVEDQATADARSRILLRTPAAKRFISYEPALGLVDFDAISITVAPGFFGSPLTWHHRGQCHKDEGITYPVLDWVIAGGESGPGARPPNADWFRSVRDQCVAAGVPFFFKQWGEWLPAMCDGAVIEGQPQELNSSDSPIRVGKKKAGRLLDGREWSEFPK